MGKDFYTPLVNNVFNKSLQTNSIVTIQAVITIKNTKTMRLGPAGNIGTDASFIIVKAGVFSCTLANACCN